jgi:hypothetical protein
MGPTTNTFVKLPFELSPLSPGGSYLLEPLQLNLMRIKTNKAVKPVICKIFFRKFFI